MTVSEFMKQTKTTEVQNRPRMICEDGFSMSVQASYRHQCELKNDSTDEYESVEVFFPNREEELLNPYVDYEADKATERNYAYVPMTVIEDIVAKHGGVQPLY